MRRTPAFSLLRTSISLLVLAAVTITAAVTASTAGQEEEVVRTEFITTYADDCKTPKTVFDPGEVVCVQAGNFPMAPDAGFQYRRISWVSPDREVIYQSDIRSDPQTDRITIPFNSSAGTWYATTLDVESSRYSNAKFVVRSTYGKTADLSITKDGPSTIMTGERIQLTLTVSNPGPDLAEGVEFYTMVPYGMEFVGLRQISGPLFECKTPEVNGTGSIYCSTKYMELDESARFYAYYVLNRDVRPGTISYAKTSVSSYTEELRKEDNYTLTEMEVVEELPILEEPPPEDGE